MLKRASGLPVVGTDVGAYRNVPQRRHRHPGAAEEPQALTDALKRLIDDRLRRRMERSRRKDGLGRSRVSPARLAETTEAILSEVVEDAPHERA